MKKSLLGLALTILTLSGCGSLVSEESAAKAAEKQGYKEVEIVSKHIFFVDWQGCSKEDDVAFQAKATNSLGQRVDITICSGWLFKGVTVRTR